MGLQGEQCCVRSGAPAQEPGVTPDVGTDVDDGSGARGHGTQEGDCRGILRRPESTYPPKNAVVRAVQAFLGPISEGSQDDATGNGAEPVETSGPPRRPTLDRVARHVEEPSRDAGGQRRDPPV
jgi:hypothetical protein